jgi:RNA polymerase sigma-70 factor (ECF subfamily)
VQDSPVATESGAIEAVYRAQGERLWRAVFAYAGDRAVADDAVAEAFAQALKRGSAVRKPERWVWRVAFRVAAGELKERRRFTVPLAEQTATDPRDLSGALLLALRRLTDKQRASLILHHYAGYRAHEIAPMIGSTTAAVRVHMSRGRKRLRELLSEGDDG